MTTTLTTAQLGLILTALNEREHVLSAAYYAPAATRSDDRPIASISAELHDVRALADLIANQLIVAKGLAA